MLIIDHEAAKEKHLYKHVPRTAEQLALHPEPGEDKVANSLVMDWVLPMNVSLRMGFTRLDERYDIVARLPLVHKWREHGLKYLPDRSLGFSIKVPENPEKAVSPVHSSFRAGAPAPASLPSSAGNSFASPYGARPFEPASGPGPSGPRISQGLFEMTSKVTSAIPFE